ncbi:MAG: hypothetical protein J6R99_03220 [Alphaproteobacteria bacterium]|nr:hypothetical protein [Alphaproteobacteria bacterium]
MKKTTTQPSLSLWTFWAPVKFALVMFIISSVMIFGYSFLSNLISAPASNTSMFAIIAISFLLSTFLIARKLPTIKIDRPSFIAINTLQSVLLSILFSVSTVLVMTKYQSIMFKLMVLDTKASGALLAVFVLTIIFFFFLGGISLLNAYIKIRRMQEFNIPTWKIICSIPFGFSALWIPGYFLDTKSSKQVGQPIKSKTYSKFVNWVLLNKTNTIATFAFTTLVLALFGGFNSMLLTFTFALLFGIWIMRVGTKKFEKQIPAKYASAAVIINIVLIIIFASTALFVANNPSKIQINISDIETIETPGNAQ